MKACAPAAIILTNRQARQFMLLKHGLLGGCKFIGKAGALAFVRQAGCIQYDPIDICGRNAELTLQSRVRGFTKAMLDELLYKDRVLFDYPDKNLALIPAEDWPYFERYREAGRRRKEQAWRPTLSGTPGKWQPSRSSWGGAAGAPGISPSSASA
jgi:uncharacterized protein YcaQ